MTAGSSAGSATAVAANVVAIAITEDTGKSESFYHYHYFTALTTPDCTSFFITFLGGSTNGPATRQHNFGYDPPKFHYPK
jgi:hypothetical protein